LSRQGTQVRRTVDSDPHSRVRGKGSMMDEYRYQMERYGNLKRKTAPKKSFNKEKSNHMDSEIGGNSTHPASSGRVEKKEERSRKC